MYHPHPLTPAWADHLPGVQETRWQLDASNGLAAGDTFHDGTGQRRIVLSVHGPGSWPDYRRVNSEPISELAFMELDGTDGTDLVAYANRREEARLQNLAAPNGFGDLCDYSEADEVADAEAVR